MIALWMIYATVVAAVAGVAAAIVERAGAATLRQRRWLWFAALALSVGIPALVISRPDRTSGMLVAGSASATETSESQGSSGAAAIASRIAELLAATDTQSLGRFDRPFSIAWGIAALLALAAYGAATWSLARRRRSWRSAVVDGQPVLLSSRVGPAVVGAVRPAIVVPEWSLALSKEQRSLMIEHERQHVRARDPLLLHASALVALLMPWNVAVWWLNRRLRLAVEIDCDARVLAGGRDASAYGMLLLDVCSRRTPPAAVLAPALLERTSSLTKRILAMHPEPVRFARSRLALGTAAALAVVVLACALPTPDMVAPADTTTTAQGLAGASAVMPVDGPANLRRVLERYFPAVARGEGDGSILFVIRSAAGEIVLTEARPASEFARQRVRVGDERTDSPSAPASRSASGPSAISALDPDAIQSIEVAKYAAGDVAPTAVSFILIALKPNVSVEKLRAAQ